MMNNVRLPVQYLWGPFKTQQGVTVMQSSVSVCDLIVSGPKETKQPDKAGSTYVAIITAKKKQRERKREGSEGKHEGETLCESGERQNRCVAQAFQPHLNLFLTGNEMFKSHW